MRIAASEEFRASPQLVAFLTFVVEAVLSGDSDRIKAYTIGVEAFGRGSGFDPPQRQHPVRDGERRVLEQRRP